MHKVTFEATIKTTTPAAKRPKPGDILSVEGEVHIELVGEFTVAESATLECLLKSWEKKDEPKGTGKSK